MPARTELRHPDSYSEQGIKVFRAGHGKGASDRALDAYTKKEGIRRAEALKRSGAEKLLEELKGNLVEGLDPKLELVVGKDPILIDDVYLELEWNSALRGKINTVRVFALPTEDILVEGAIASLMPKSLWESDKGKEVLEGIVKHAFGNPSIEEE